jgi:hypothetical protein
MQEITLEIGEGKHWLTDSLQTDATWLHQHMHFLEATS